MKVFKKILCPLDFSEVSRHAFQYAKAFAETFESELVLLHVSPNITEAYSALMPDFPTHTLQKAEDLIYQFNEFTHDWSGKLKKIIRAGTPYIEILDYTKEQQFDLIILGAKGHSNFERLFLGSTGEKVAQNSDWPVLTVHPKPKGLPIKKILVPIDFSPLSYAVLPTVAALAEKFNAEINLLHVVEMGHYVNTRGQVKEYNFFERIKERLEEQWQLPKEFDKIEINKFIRHHVGSAGYGILEFAQDWDVDLIVMATHGRTGLSKVMMGSVTEKVIRIAPYPVLSVRSQISEKRGM
jgi:nucleotide-binding universal stress UspA family protein